MRSSSHSRPHLAGGVCRFRLELSRMSDDALAVWSRNAGFWDDFLGEGNEFQEQLIMPATDRLLAIRAGDKVLDAACGNGNYSRRLAAAGARVVAFDGAAPFIDRARQRTATAGLSIDYRVIDATNETALSELQSDGPFRAAVCSMALMDFDPLDPLLRTIHSLLEPGGCFVFSLPHPCFNSNGAIMTAELHEHGGRNVHHYGVKVSRYATSFMDLSTGLLHQPEPHPLYHRSLATIFQTVFRAGFIIDGLEEPLFSPGTRAKNAFAWPRRPDIPPAIVLRARPA